MPIVRDDEQERQGRIDKLVNDLADAQRAIHDSQRKAHKIVKELDDLRARAFAAVNASS